MPMLDHPSVRGPESPHHASGQRPTDLQTNQRETSTKLIVKPWWDPYLAVHGFNLNDPYVEAFWLGVLGPSVVCLLRRFARGFDKHPNGFQLSLPDTAKAIGLGSGTGRNAPINRTIDRACTFHLIRRVNAEQVDVRTHLPPLTQRQLARLPVSVRIAHENWAGPNESNRSSISSSNMINGASKVA